MLAGFVFIVSLEIKFCSCLSILFKYINLTSFTKSCKQLKCFILTVVCWLNAGLVKGIGPCSCSYPNSWQLVFF